MPITVNGSGTITGVSVGGLPDGIVDTDMIAAGAVTQAKRGAATGTISGVLQIVTGTASTEVTVDTATYTDIGLSASITPSSSSNKILILANFPAYFSRNGGQGGGVKVLRGSTSIYASYSDANGPYEVFNGDSSIGVRFNFSQLDSPATTSATTYKFQGRPYATSNSGRADFFEGDSTGYIILMEVAA